MSVKILVCAMHMEVRQELTSLVDCRTEKSLTPPPPIRSRILADGLTVQHVRQPVMKSPQFKSQVLLQSCNDP